MAQSADSTIRMISRLFHAILHQEHVLLNNFRMVFEQNECRHEYLYHEERHDGFFTGPEKKNNNNNKNK